MKRFLTSIPRQKILDTDDAAFPYIPVEADELLYKPVPFPVLALMNACVSAGDKVALIALRLDPRSENDLSEVNFRALSESAAELCAEKGAEFEIIDFRVPNDETITTQLSIFGKLIEKFSTGDEVFADLTYGTKPQMLSQFFALNFVSEALEGASVVKVVYGSLDFSAAPGTNRKRIYDITPLFMMNRIVNRLGEFGHPDPVDAIRKLLETDN